MRTKLKQFRVQAGMTQAKLARKVGVTQPNYQRWESGSAPVPEEKLKKLAKVGTHREKPDCTTTRLAMTSTTTEK
jgi:transcriptional regulator with XRE-family HTH domain